MTNQPNKFSAISIVPANNDDLLPILSLFDETVVWLNQRGLAGQWGTEPFSTSAKTRERFMGWIEHGAMFVARYQAGIVGTLVLNPTAPRYIADRWEHFPTSAFYLEAFVTARTLLYQGLGHALLQWAEQHARAVGKVTLWLDCWAENTALVHYYKEAGFTPRGEFGNATWRGQLFEKSLI
ncbi:MAG: GNAT family N-acetyltransferase [Ktedonobacteraceae bacterium]